MAMTWIGTATRRPQLPGLLATAMLVNVAVPLAIASDGYAPGAITAITRNLPVATWYPWPIRRVRQAASRHTDRTAAAASDF